jgi:magnesium-transporting ATPase (P-type)
MTTQPKPQQAWHVLGVEDTLKLLDARTSGLTDDEAKIRVRQYGPNRLPERQPPSVWLVLLRQFYNPLMYILLIAIIAALAIGDMKDAIFIAVALALNAIIGTYQEWTAERSSLALRRLLRIQATAQRNGDVRVVSAEELVPGDVIWLESGNRVPADVRLLEATGLEIDESLLTGESLAVRKDPNWTGPEQAPLGDRSNLAFAGAIVTRGRGKGVVVGTGTATAVGQLALDVIGTVSGKSPLLSRMDRFSKIVAVGTFILAAVTGGLGILLGHSPHEMLMFAIALAVAAIPSGLPVAMTVALAVAMT